jgi:N6-adenosine-specific RNA methylase IME4
MSHEKFGLVLADPPWWYNSRKTGGERSDRTRFGGGASKHYPLMPDKELTRMARILPRWLEDNAIMLMWATMPRLDYAIYLMGEAGFSYRTNAFTWLKTTNDGSNFRYGPGFYTASNVEVVLLGVRGQGMQPVQKMTESVICTPRYAHSQKPPLHETLDKMYPYLNKIELFARRVERPGWTYWGNEIDTKPGKLELDMSEEETEEME